VLVSNQLKDLLNFEKFIKSELATEKRDCFAALETDLIADEDSCGRGFEQL
jgi:hypothetical protein